MGVAAVGVILTLLAFTFDAAPLFVPGVAFALIGALVPAWIYLAATNAHVQRRLLADRAVEGEPVEAMIEITRGPLGLPGGEVRDPLAGMPVAVGRPLAIITGAAKAEVRVVARFPRRGLRRLEPPALAVGDMLGLATRVRTGDGPTQELLVLPRTERVRWSTRQKWPPPGGRQRRAVRGAARRERHRRTAPVPARDLGLADPLVRPRPRSRTARAPAAG